MLKRLCSLFIISCMLLNLGGCSLNGGTDIVEYSNNFEITYDNIDEVDESIIRRQAWNKFFVDAEIDYPYTFNSDFDIKQEIYTTANEDKSLMSEFSYNVSTEGLFDEDELLFLLNYNAPTQDTDTYYGFMSKVNTYSFADGFFGMFHNLTNQYGYNFKKEDLAIFDDVYDSYYFYDKEGLIYFVYSLVQGDYLYANLSLPRDIDVLDTPMVLLAFWSNKWLSVEHSISWKDKVYTLEYEVAESSNGRLLGGHISVDINFEEGKPATLRAIRCKDLQVCGTFQDVSLIQNTENFAKLEGQDIQRYYVLTLNGGYSFDNSEEVSFDKFFESKSTFDKEIFGTLIEEVKSKEYE